MILKNYQLEYLETLVEISLKFTVLLITVVHIKDMHVCMVEELMEEILKQ